MIPDDDQTVKPVPLTESAPWKRDAGYPRDEPLFDARREAIEENRRKLDEEIDAQQSIDIASTTHLFPFRQ